jgi:hypothetical protein
LFIITFWVTQNRLLSSYTNKQLQFVEEQKTKKSLRGLGSFRKVGRDIMQSTPQLKKTGRYETLDGGFNKPLLALEKKKEGVYDLFSKTALLKRKQDYISNTDTEPEVFSYPISMYKKPIDERPPYVFESLDEKVKPLLRQELGHNQEDFSYYLSKGNKSNPPLNYSKYYHSFIPFNEESKKEPSFGISIKHRNEQAQCLISPLDQKPEVYEGDDIRAPLYQVELREIEAIKNRYSTKKAHELTMREEMDRLAKKAKGKHLYDY